MGAIVYIFKASIALMIFHLLYSLVFSKLTFFRFNRFYLLFSILLSSLLPFIEFPSPVSGFEPFVEAISIDWDELMQISDSTGIGLGKSNHLSVFSVILALYFVVSTWRVVRSFVIYRKVRKLYSNGVIEMHRKVRWNIHPEIYAPFTMFRTVYVDRQMYEQGDTPILKHEVVHARELHSLDLLIMEIVCAFLWINPFVFLLKRQMRENHEFLADHSAHSDKDELIEYMHSLSFEIVRNLDPAVASYFQSSTLKKRVIMLTNKRSKKSKKLLYLAVLPLVAFMAMAFQQSSDKLLLESSSVSIVREQATLPVNKGRDGIPERFPLEFKYKERISWEFGKEAKNPITGKLQVHKGVDIVAPKGAPVYASGRGKVVKVTSHDGYGKFIIIMHKQQLSSLYAHLDTFLVAEGDEVVTGKQIGTVGNTGRSTGPHLHYEIRKAGESVNPADYY